MSINLELIDYMPTELLKAAIPAKTSTYQPVGHHALVDYTGKILDQAGIQIVDSHFGHAAKGDIMAGTLILNKGNKEFNMQLGLRNSYNKSQSLGYASGGSVIACTNSMFTGDVVALRKHSSSIGEEVPKMLKQQISVIDTMFSQYAEDIEVMKSVELSRNAVHEIVGEMFLDQKLITTTQINIIRRELYHSENFQMFGAGGTMSLWNLYQNSTESLKVSHASRFFKDHSDVRALMLNYA